MDISGNTLSFALSVFEIAISNPEFQIELLSIKIIEKIITLLDHQLYSINISNPLKIALKLTQSKEGYKITDVNTQTFSLSLINNMIAYSENVSEFLDEIEEYSLSNILKKQLNTTDVHFKKQIYRLQNLKLQEFIRDCSTQYNKDDPNHERMLQKLWDIMFVGEAFQPVDERWKSIGFQGKDPSTDFRGMGIAGLKHLLYLANNHLDTFRTITQHQTNLQSNPITSDRYYPVAVCGIHITSMLLELMKPPPNIKENEENILPIIFDHKYSVAEIYCITLDIFEMVWEEAAARYMDFERVKTVLKSQISETISKATTIMGFRTSNTGRKKLVDYKKLVNETYKKNGSGTRQSKSFNSGYDAETSRKSNDHTTGNPIFSRSTDSQHELLTSPQPPKHPGNDTDQLGMHNIDRSDHRVSDDPERNQRDTTRKEWIPSDSQSCLSTLDRRRFQQDTQAAARERCGNRHQDTRVHGHPAPLGSRQRV
ncbi:ankyrin repeat-containing protein [Heterostelium album PN500]|uniref:Ankyrin repeat-containing protein n=1 Tax=Heterostelium pallidum (strain ATCC 26659 / Pp 5 / PN500) TaxID=670386 RepID=D3B7R0_HETP5|nr:ankyrin repeat-containing protein [Heterostelium album PN500]EFA82803.1 ankyrin repeat-containing protein [Heterostelium album PN500]|eukprot:XP_020434920.1 ankyrin repeat-containing protein [Heterostelium album PN500]